MQTDGGLNLLPYPWSAIVLGGAFALNTIIVLWGFAISRTEGSFPISLKIAQYGVLVFLGGGLIAVLLERPNALIPAIIAGMAIGGAIYWVMRTISRFTQGSKS
jgi:hypothetical protein